MLALLSAGPQSHRCTMAQMTIRRLNEELYRKLKVRAARHGRSAEAEVREILRQTLTEDETRAASEDWVRRAEALARTLPRSDANSADLIREERDRRSGLID
jgi:plasmid stability protein